MPDGKPFRITFTPRIDVDETRLAANLHVSREYPKAQRGVHPHPVAVVGGGPSLVDRLEELRGWPGDIWAINQTADWLRNRGIEATLFSVDSAEWAIGAAKSALLATCCDPSMFRGHGEIRVFDMAEHAEVGISGGTTSAGRAPALALLLGYPGVAFFGCDSSFVDSDHVDRHEGQAEMLMVRANGADYKTRPDLLLQAQELSQLLRTFDAYFHNHSAGLLAAMVVDEDWEIVGVSAGMKATLIAANGDSGLYDTPYAGIA
jgi:hypothetical protein